MQYMTIVTQQHFDDNQELMHTFSKVGSFDSINLHGVASGTGYQTIKGVEYEGGHTVDENLKDTNDNIDEEAIIDGIELAFADLIAGNIPAISMSIPLFLKLQQRPEFSPNSTVTIFLESFTSEADIGQIAPTHLTGTMPYKVTLNSEWVGNIFEPDLSKDVVDVTTDLLAAFADLMAGSIEAIRMPVAVFLQVQNHSAFSQ